MAQQRPPAPNPIRRHRGTLRLPAILASILLPALGAWWFYLDTAPQAARPIAIGLLYSQSGTMAADESALADAMGLAVEEINADGGIGGSPVEIKLGDGRSDPDLFAAEAERLITREHVAALFGCWTSACRKTVKAVVERHDHLLFYPLQFEGLEQSPNIVYLGEAPNQQIIPATSWALQNLGKRLYLVGSDYVFPRIANAIIRRQVELLGGTIVGEDYRPLADRNFGAIAQNIVQARPDAILNTINGDGNLAFFAALRDAGVTPDKIPVLSFSVAEGRDVGQLPGDYAAWSYFQSLPNPANQVFVAAFRQRYGEQRRISSPMEASYAAIKLWAAAAQTGDFAPAMVRSALSSVSLIAPGGPLALDQVSQHAWKTARLGRLDADGIFRVVWSSAAPIRPEPFPRLFSMAEWSARLDDLYRAYGGAWSPAERGSEP